MTGPVISGRSWLEEEEGKVVKMRREEERVGCSFLCFFFGMANEHLCLSRTEMDTILWPWECWDWEGRDPGTVLMVGVLVQPPVLYSF